MSSTITGDAVAAERYRRAATVLHDAAKPIRVLSRLAWPAELRERFLAAGGNAMPEPEYEPLDPTDTLDGVAAARRDARFTRRDGAQLLNHEAYIHVGTALNGRAQPDLPILAVGHPGTTRTQDGLAVFSEFVSGTLELDRLRRLADRTLAVQMVCEGADFVELYRWFLDRSPNPEQAFESTRRVFRGGPLTGGAPFTKDCGYLSGLLGVMTFLRAAFAADRADTLGLPVGDILVRCPRVVRERPWDTPEPIS